MKIGTSEIKQTPLDPESSKLGSAEMIPSQICTKLYTHQNSKCVLSRSIISKDVTKCLSRNPSHLR